MFLSQVMGTTRWAPSEPFLLHTAPLHPRPCCREATPGAFRLLPVACSAVEHSPPMRSPEGAKPQAAQVIKVEQVDWNTRLSYNPHAPLSTKKAQSTWIWTVTAEA